MKRLNSILLIILVAQLCLLAVFLWPREQPGAGQSDAPLLALDGADVDRLIIGDGETSVGLTRDGNRWILPDYQGLPVDGGKLDDLLTTLPGLARGWPVAQTSGALQRFEVADDEFQRRLEYYSDGEEMGTIYLGTSPGFRKVHTRPADAGAVYAVEFNAFDAPVAANDWLDKTLLQVADVTGIQGLDYTLRLDGEQWLGEGELVPEQSQVDALLNGLTSLRVTGVADIATAAVLDELDAPATLTVTSGESTREFRLYEIEDAHYIRRDDIPVYFSLSAYDYDRLNDVNAVTLFPPAEDTAAADGELSEAETADTDTAVAPPDAPAGES